MVNKKVCPQDWGRGPTRSMWIWENLRPGTGICRMGDFLWVWAFLHWQFRQDWDHKFTYLDSPSQTKLLEINLLDAHKPGLEILWINSTPSFSSSPEPGGGGYQWTCHSGDWNLSREQKIFPKQKCFFKDLKSKKKEVLSCCMQIWLCSLNKIKYFFFKTNYSIISTITLGFLIPVILIFAILSFFSFCRGGRAPPSQVLGEGARPAPPSCASGVIKRKLEFYQILNPRVHAYRHFKLWCIIFITVCICLISYIGFLFPLLSSYYFVSFVFYLYPIFLSCFLSSVYYFIYVSSILYFIFYIL